MAGLESVPAKQYNLIDAFRRYLIAACWRKLVSCTIQWSYSEMLHHLHEISHEQVKIAFTQHHDSCSNAFSKLNNGLLLDEMDIFFNNETMMKCLMSSYPSLLPHFMALKVKYLSARLRKKKQLKEGMTIYDEATCFEFHQLLIATFVSFARELSQLNMTPRNNSVVWAKLCILIFCFAFLIWGLTESCAIWFTWPF